MKKYVFLPVILLLAYKAWAGERYDSNISYSVKITEKGMKPSIISIKDGQIIKLTNGKCLRVAENINDVQYAQPQHVGPALIFEIHTKEGKYVRDYAACTNHQQCDNNDEINIEFIGKKELFYRPL